MIIQKLQQGTPEWHEHRRTHYNASDAPAMMGCSPHESRDQLIARLATGVAPEIDAATQRRFNEGHRFEALARPLAEEIVGDDLSPLVGSLGIYSASFDGITLTGDVQWEHKSLNNILRSAMFEGCTGHDLPIMYCVQNEHQLMVSGAERALFMTSKWDGDTLIEERHCWCVSDPWLRASLIAGWKQLGKEVAAYVPAAAVAPAPTGRAPDTLPALFVTVSGQVTSSNLAEFKEVALSAIRSVNRDLQNDQDFANAEKAVKWCADIEKRVSGAKEQALAQTQSIDELFKTMDDISTEARAVRLDLDKLVKARKLSLKAELISESQNLLEAHIQGLEGRIGQPYMPRTKVDFAAAIHGKSNFDLMRSALNSALANAKVEANQVADRINVNMETLKELASEYEFLFMDAAVVVLKATDDFTALAKMRIAEHQTAEAAKEEATRLRIRAEEVAKAQQYVAEKVAAEAAKEEQAAPPASPVMPAKPVGRVVNSAPNLRHPTQQQVIDLIEDHYGLTPAEILAWITFKD